MRRSGPEYGAQWVLVIREYFSQSTCGYAEEYVRSAAGNPSKSLLGCVGGSVPC